MRTELPATPALVRKICDEFRPGQGMLCLFSGENGAGKTMAADLIAQELGLQLYRVDLSAVVSKYIGETEKNLRRVFGEAERKGAVLFFDEADALFGGRSAPKDSRDRYGDVAITYLRRRMETYPGLAIFAASGKRAVGTGFLRRFRYIIHFPA